MSESIYERYKAVLRRGHLAVLRGQLDLALEAYREAAAIVPERALPHMSIGAVELRRGRPAEALEAFEAALERSPNDEAALSGRADALAALGRRAAAAETLDRLAALLEADGRFAEACEAVARALDLAESRSRRQQMTLLTTRLRASPLDAAAEAALGRALRVLGEPIPPGGGPTDGGATPAAPAVEESAEPAPSAESGAIPGAGESALALGAPKATAVGEPAPAPSVAGAVGPQTAEAEAPTPAEGEEERPSEAGPAPLPADAVARITMAAEEALEAGDRQAAIDGFLEAAAAHAAAGRTTAALDACARVVTAYPDALEAQEALVHLYLELGWRPLALEKVALLDRLTDLGSDPFLRARVLILARELGIREPAGGEPVGEVPPSPESASAGPA